MASRRTVDFLPEIFQTSTNKQFLSATLDQLVQEPNFKKTQGYVGRKVGPGVNPADKYVIEPTKSRTDYQLEPGVVSVDANDSTKILDAITYPGINDALALQGSNVDNADRLYKSDYYSWDPFVDFDKFINFSQYYWLPAGPLAVDVSATTIPLTDDFSVTRANGSYTLSGIAGKNPSITLVRGGNYTFQVDQNNKETVNYRVQNKNIASYIIDYESNPTLTLVRGNTYVFTLNLDGVFPFYIKTAATLGNTNQYTSGVTNNGAITGTVTFTVPQNAPDTLYYVCSTELNMRGQLNIVDGTPGTGSGFWIQTDPGVTGKIPSTPNISSRTVLGVTNNGADLGTINFNVPLSTAQNFYYSMDSIGTVDLITDLLFNQINNQSVESFINTYGGIDGITSLNGRTLVFSTQYTGTEQGGWEQTVLGDPFAATPVPENQRFGVWQIQYVTISGTDYIQLVFVQEVDQLNKFTILFGTQWASTGWYKNAEGTFEEIPLLTAIKDVLYYQDGSDPEIFGEIKIVDESKASTLVVTDIIGKRNYTSPNGVVFTNGLKVVFRGTVEPASYQNQSYYVEGVGTAIKLLPVSNYITPETYTQSQTVPYASVPYDVGNYDETLNAPEIPDYLTINRASPDLNPWSRSNRWFHIDVINASAEYNNTAPVVDNLFRARRPILEYRAGTKLFDFGTQGKQPVDIIDFQTTDALSTINGTIGYSIDGYNFINGTRVIFANDSDPQVRNKIYVVSFITPDSEVPLIAEPVINLTPASDADVLYDQTVVCLSGNTLQGVSFWFDGVDWIESQQKTATNQAPLFDVYDKDGVSFSNIAKYPSTTFAGSKLFSYATGTGTVDEILGFALKYLSLANVGDIVFDNNLYKDTFVYVNNNVGTTVNVSEGFVREYSNRTSYVKEIGWQTAVTPTIVRQQFQFTYDGKPLKLDVAVSSTTVVPAVQLYVNSAFQDPSNYTTSIGTDSTVITLNTVYVPGDIIEVAVISDQVSKTGFYQVPNNLENNPLNVNSEYFTLGTARSHYETIGQNLVAIQGPIIGANNTRDLGNIIPYGLQILQQSSPLTLSGYFMRNQSYDIFSSIEYNSREYIKFKSVLMDTVARNDYGNLTIAQILDSAILEITQGRTDIDPFYWSDMLPSGSVFTENSTTITAISTATFNTIQTYDFTSSNYKGLLVYLTRNPNTETQTITLLERDADYTVSTDSPRLTITVNLQIGDIVTIREYTDTAGSYVPNTPSKMGLYPKYLPELFLDENYVNPTFVIRGHDGSITLAFGDFRDEVLLEFEKRIYNNIKVDDNPIPLTFADVAPGFFRTTQYSQEEITNILGESFLSWVGWNKLDYKAQDFVQSNPFTYNYSSAGNRINNQPLPGAWRGIARNFYDTLSPNTTPWEMLGLSEKPSWWEDRYGPAPYTSDNLVLWDDLENGLVADPIAPYIVPNYVRPGLTQVIPTGTEGQLLAPIDSVVGPYDPTAFRKSWVVGDGGPVEASWWMSSSYPFAVMRLLALTRPAEFFALFADRDLYRYNLEFDQVLYNGRYRLDANGVEVYGNGLSKASYINWIVDYNRQSGINSTTALTTDLANLDVRLCYRMASFTDKQYLKVFTERSSPNSLNSSLLLPDDSYHLMLYKNQPFSKITYSALIIEQLENGYAVYGYNNATPYFEIFASAANGVLTTVSAGGASVKVPTQYTNTVVQVPYGYVFTNTTVVVDFILSYGAYLQSQGLVFSDVENGYTLDWGQMAQEFLYFSQQGWAPGTIVNLNPVATKFIATKAGAVVDTIISSNPENMLMNQNRQELPTRDLIIERLDNTFTITSPTAQTISFLNLKFTNYESIVILDNVSIFQDLIYDPATGARQGRIKIAASTAADWTGQLDAKGFILNQDNIKEWKANRKYTKGEVVLYKNIYWSAIDIVQPKIKFDYNDWVKSDYTVIQQGLLPNIANKADQLANSYNTQSANLERDNDLLSYGLIGFRPREYMAALNLDDVSQVNVYQQFIGNKGTLRSAELFKQVDLSKESGEYNIYENWGVLAATYGANAARAFIELRLNEANLPSNPSTVQVVLPGETSIADQSILLENVWRESYKLTSTNILPTTYTTVTDTALPSAGYVNLNDVDITVFDLNDPSSISANLDTIGIGTIIWVAKVNSYDWDIYRCEKIAPQMTQLVDNLNGSSLAQFSGTHNLSVGDFMIVRYFNNSVDGVYRVLSVPSTSSVTIAFSFVNTNQTTISGTGLVFYLQSARVAQPSDVSNLPYANELIPGAKAWVDNDGNGKWTVLEKQPQFTEKTSLFAPTSVANSGFGTSVTQTGDHYSALIGAPNAGTSGLVYTYRRNENNGYSFNLAIELNATATEGFGNAVKFGNQNWALAGASASEDNNGYTAILYQIPSSNDYKVTQLLVEPAFDSGQTRFGAAVTISQDERWAYVGAPDGNRVHAYGRVDVEDQSVSYVTDGVNGIFNYATHLVIDYTQPEQMFVTLNNQNQIYGTDYTINASSVVFNTIPAAGLTLKIARRQATQLDQTTYYGVTQNSTSGIGSGAIFTVDNVRGQYNVSLTAPGTNYAVNDTITINYTQIEPTGSSSNNLVLTVDAVVSGGITAFSPTNVVGGITNRDTFILSDYLYTVTDDYSFTVEVDGIIQRLGDDYTFDEVTKELQFSVSANPPAGAVISLQSFTHWQYIDTIEYLADADAQFGQSVTTTIDGRRVMIGAPRDNDGSLNNIGSVQVYDRSVVRYLIDDTSQLTYSIPGTPAPVVAVLLNGQYLNIRNITEGSSTRTAFINGVVDIDLDSNEITFVSSSTLTVGDILEIETNEFRLVQKIISHGALEEARYGDEVVAESSGNAFYVGAPLDSSVRPQAGSVESQFNQSLKFGVIESTIANPSLTIGDTIRINNYEIEIPTTNTIAGLVSAINLSNNGVGVPNVLASSTPDLTFIADGSTKVYNIGSIYAVAESYTTVVYVDDVLQTSGVSYTYDANTNDILFVSAPAKNSEIIVVSGRLTLSVKNLTSATGLNKLNVSPGLVGSAFDDIGFETYVWTQTITSPNPSDYAYFGTSIDVDADIEPGTGVESFGIIVGAPNGNVYEPVTFDGGETRFDDRSTTFFSPVINSGVAYTYDYLLSVDSSVSNPGRYVFGEQIYDLDVKPGDQFATDVSYSDGRLLVGIPGDDIDDSSLNYGRAGVYDTPADLPAWAPIHIEQPVVDVSLINGVFMYDRLISSTQQYFDFFNPLQGKILGAARRNIDYIGAVDPANYNQGTVHNNGNSWAEEHVGEIWWDTDTVRFIDPNQDDITYASRRWGQVFPGSRADIYQWVSSSVAPAVYTGPGIPLSLTSYTINSNLNKDNIFETRYYFWVRGITTINTGAGKTLSATGIASYIENPRSSGIPYIAPLTANTVAIYNALDLISASDTILHIDYDRIANNANIHTEYELIASGKADAFLSPTLYRKLQDSFCGVNEAGALVPDPTLSPPERYGVQFRPRQSMFADRFTALENYLTRVNSVLAQYPISESRSFNLLNSAEPIPTYSTGTWNKTVANLEILGYQNLAVVPYGYKYLVLTDSSQNGLWTIYEVVVGATFGSKALNLVRVQNYDTRRYWSYVNWYQPGYNSTISPKAEVSNYAGLKTVSLKVAPVGSSVKVTANAQGKFEIYLRTDTGWDRVGLEDGTIQIDADIWNYALGNFGFDSEVFDSQYFDQEPSIETRKIIQAINEELLIDDLAIDRNSALMLVFDYIYTEFEAPEWLIKTSLVDVDHKIRELLPYQTYLQDNQTFVLDYIQEVKPYHVQIREFNLTYNGLDIYSGDLTDFDLPAYYNTSLVIPQYVSPILLPYTHANTSVQSDVSDSASDAEVWTLQPWKQWYDNYLLSIQDVTIIDGGEGYTVPPTVEVTGTCVTPAEITAIINSAGRVVGVDVVTPGVGYQTTAIITFTGGNGTGAKAVAVMGNDLVRSIKTVIKYDRYQYNSTIVDWEANVSYDNGTQVRYLDRVWSANSGDSSPVNSPEFYFDEWIEVAAGTLSGIDRTQGFYTPTANEPGRELPLVIDGLDYPGVQVFGPLFSQNTGYDVGNYDINPYDNISYGPEGQPTYDPKILDAIYESSYLDPYLGTRATDVNVDGGAYIDTYSSHAPEELIPGSEFDTLDLRVYTRPGSDWLNDGHGFAQKTIKAESTDTSIIVSFAGLLTYPTQIEVFNQSLGIALALDVDYSIDWVDQTVSVTSQVTAGDVIVVTAFGLGGGNQLYKDYFTGDTIVSNVVTIPVNYNEINELAIFVNGVYLPQTLDDSTDNYTYSANGTQTDVEFTFEYGSTDYISLTAIGLTTVNGTDVAYSWSTPQTQYIVADGSSVSYALTNSLQYSNPDNLIVTLDGDRLRTSAGAEYYGDGSTEFLLPDRLGFSQILIADPEVHVYLDDVPQILGVDYTVTPYDAFSHGGIRSVVFTNEPAIGVRILITVNTQTQCYVNAGNLQFTGTAPTAGSIIAVTTWNDTRQQNLLNKVFVGPDILGNNNLQLGRVITNPSRLFVTLNGQTLLPGLGFTISGEELVLTSGVLGSTDIVMVTMYTESVVPNAIAFRIFQDMRGVQATYRITDSTTTTLSQALDQTDDIIYVEDASKLSEPNLAINIWGVITINGERIMYRERDTIENTISGLLRGTAGTGAADHEVGSYVYDMSRGNLLPINYQDYIVSNLENDTLNPSTGELLYPILGDGTNTTFVAEYLDVSTSDSTVDLEAVEVYIGGTLQTTGYTITAENPVTVEFDTAPADGVQVTILVRRGVTWYAPGVDTPSNGVPLQDTDTYAARFIRGEI